MGLGADVGAFFQSLPGPMNTCSQGGTETWVTVPSLPPYPLVFKEIFEVFSFGHQWMAEASYTELNHFLHKSLVVVTAAKGAGVIGKAHKTLMKWGAPLIMSCTGYPELWLSPECCLCTQTSFPSCSSSRNVQALFLTDCW